MKYTRKIHKKRLLQMLEGKNPCGHCPAGEDFIVDWEKRSIWSNPYDTCDICKGFIKIPTEPLLPCPCNVLGKDEAIKRSWIALEEEGMLE